MSSSDDENLTPCTNYTMHDVVVLMLVPYRRIKRKHRMPSSRQLVEQVGCARLFVCVCVLCACLCACVLWACFGTRKFDDPRINTVYFRRLAGASVQYKRFAQSTRDDDTQRARKHHIDMWDCFWTLPLNCAYAHMCVCVICVHMDCACGVADVCGCTSCNI